ncbi:MAG: signal peptidase I [Clostridia bacterium]|nr:signal peptidase I [Clostridia bacterium]
MSEENKIVNQEDSSVTSAGSPAPDKSPKQTQKKGAVHFLFDVVEMFAWSVLVVLLLFSFVVRLCRVEGSSMENTLYEGESLLIYSLGYTPEQDDIIVFHQTNTDFEEKAIVKRVIATSGQKIEIHFDTKKIFVDGVEYADSHKVLKNKLEHNIDIYTLTAAPASSFYHYDTQSDTLTATVPDGHLFVLGDNRNFSRDSRDPSIGFVDERCVLGKAIIRISPFTVFS